MSLLGINRNDAEHFIAYNPNTDPNSDPVLTKSVGGYPVDPNTFTAGTNDSLATARFGAIHIGGGYNDGTGTGSGLTITSEGIIKTNGTITQAGQTGGLRLAPTTNYRTSGDVYNVVSDLYYTLDDIGKIVVSTNNYRNTDSLSQNAINNITFEESLPVVALSSNAKDKRVFGVITGQSYSGRLEVQSFGEGQIKVCDTNGPLEVGDYITSAGMKGIGMKQTEDYMTNATVAKVTKAVTFENSKYIQENGTQITKDQYNLLKADGRKVAKMAIVECVFVCGA